MLKRRSVRKYTDKSIEKELIEKMLKAAMAAPSGHNAQPWSFVVVDQREVLDELSEVHKYAKMLKEAQLCIVVCGESYAGGRYQTLWSQDCAAATENILLQATELGIGTVWLGVYPSETSTTRVKRILDLPDEITPFGLISLGYPAEEKEPRTQYTEDKVHLNKWGKKF
jgi:nitroreductase